MRIRRMYLNGFGIHRERTFELDPAAPAALFFGMNEAGKSTIMGFIRAMLFGFPTRANMPERFEPVSGGLHGGILTVIDGQGREVRIERYEKNGSLRLMFPDGTEGGEAALQALLGGITPDLYRSLFAFSLSELERIDTLQQEELGNYLFSAGMGVSGNAIVQLERKLAARMDELFKPRGSRQEINKLLKELETTESELRQSREISAAYPAKREELSRLDAAIASEEAQLERLRAEREWLNKCVQAGPAWARLKEIEQRLGELPAFERFPEDALRRLEALLAEQDRLARELNEIKAKRGRHEEKLAQSRPHERLIALRPELKALLEDAVRYEENAQQVPQLQSELAHAREQLAFHLRQIDPDWTEAELRAFPMTVSRREEVRRFGEEFAALKSRRLAAETELERLARRGEALKQAQEERKRSEEEARARGEGEFAPLRRLIGGSESQGAFESRLRGALEDARRSAGEAVRIRQRLDDLRQSEALLREGKSGSGDSADGARRARPSAGRWQPVLLASAALAISLAFSLWLWLGQGLAAEAGVLFAVLGAAGGIWLARALRSAGRAADNAGGGFDPVRRTYAERRAQLESELAEMTANWRKQRDQLLQLIGREFLDAKPAFASTYAAQAEAAAAAEPGTDAGRDAGADPIAELGAIESAANALLAGLRRLEGHENKMALFREQTAAAERAVREWEREQKLARDHWEELREHEAGLAGKWREWLRDCRLSAELAPESVGQIFHHAEQALSFLRQAEKAGAELDAARKLQAAFERSAAAFIAKLESEGEASGARPPAADAPVSGSGLIHKLKVWQDALEEQAGLQKANLLLLQELDDLAANEVAKNAELSALRDKREQLLQDAGAEDEEHFRRLARLYEERSELSAEKHRQESAIFLWVNRADARRLEETLQQHDPDQLRQRLQELDEAIAAKGEELNEGKDRRGRLRQELDMLRSGEAHGALLQRHQEQVASFEQLASRWAELALCAELIRRSREIYERERQPGVLQRASSYFRLITGGKYVRVISRIGEKTLHVEKENGEQLGSAFLSRGTAEQLYLAMRFALADEYAKTAALPIVMDDIFVNFDAERLARSLAVVAEASRRHQIVLFTCHRHVAEAMAEAVPGLQRIDLHS